MADDVKIKVDADASAVEKAMAAGKAAAKNFADSLTSSIGGAAQHVANSLADVALAAGKVSFSAQHAQVREFEGASARLAVAMGRDLESVRKDLEATGRAIGMRPREVAAWASEVGKLTYNMSGAEDAIRGMAGLAAETGRSVDDYRGLAVMLGTVGGVAGDTTDVIGRLAAQAESMGVKGGVAAFADQIQGLGDVISRFSGESTENFLKVTQAAAMLGKGLSPEAAGRAQQGVFGTIAADPRRWERFLGRQLMDEHGQIPKEDLPAIMHDIVAKTVRQRGERDARRVLMLPGNFGPEAGAALFNTFKSGFASESSEQATSDKPTAALAALQKTDAGQRAVAEAELSASSRNLMGSSTALGKAADALQKFSASNPITSTFVSSAVGGTLAAFMASYGKSIATMVGGTGAGGAAGGVLTLAGLGKGGGALGKLGLAGAAAASAAYAYGEISDTAKELYGVEGKGGSFGKDLSEFVGAQTGISKGNAAFVSAEARKARIAELEAQGIDRGKALYIAEHEKEKGFDPSAITRAVADGAKNMKVTIVNATGGPIEVAGQQSQSSAAGNMSGG